MNNGREQTAYDAIVVGSGPGGVVSAALAAQRGLRVLLAEKNAKAGGKMMTVSRDGFTYDLWPHGQVPVTGNAFETVFATLGVSDELGACLDPTSTEPAIEMKYRRPGERNYRGAAFPQAMADPTPFFNLWGISAEEQERAVTLMTELAIMDKAEVDKLDAVTMHDYLSGKDISAALYGYMAFHSNASLAEPIDLVSAGEQIRILQQIMLSGGGGSYRGGFGHLSDVIAREFERHGGKLVTGARVERIIVENGRAGGVVLDGEPVRAPIVISNAGLQPTVIKLVGREHFEASYFDAIGKLVPGWGFTASRYFLNRKVTKVPMLVAYSDETWWNLERYERFCSGEIPDEVIVFATVVDNYDPEAAPPDKQCIIAGTICPPDPEVAGVGALHQRVDRMFETQWPEIWSAIEHREYAGPAQISATSRDSVLPGQGGECVGLAQIVGQCGADKPSVESPIDGLYYVGADAGATGMGTHSAALSGIMVADLITRRHRESVAAQG